MTESNQYPRLETPETTAPKVFHRSYRSYRVSNMTDELDRTRSIYEALETRTTFTKSEKLDKCGYGAFFVRHIDTGDVRVMSSKCNLRWCPMCARTKQHFVTKGVLGWVREALHPKFMTLTVKHNRRPLADQVTELYDSFRKLRKLRDFNHYVTGGIWFFQIKKSSSDGLWHPHLHCLIDGLYLPKFELSDMWKQSTGGSSIVDIRPVSDPKKIAQYVSRYVARPSILSDMNLSDGMEVVLALHGRRFCGSWGTAKGVKLGKPKCEDPEKWQSVGKFRTIVGLYEVDTDARTIYDAWRNRKSIPPGITFRGLDADIDDDLIITKKPPPEPYLTNFFGDAV